MARSTERAISVLASLELLVVNLRRRRRFQLALLSCLMLVSAIAEAMSLGAVVPFLAILVDPVGAMERPLIASVASWTGAGGAEELRWYVTLLFAFAAVAAATMRLTLIYATARFNYGVGHELVAEIFRRTLHQPYDVHIGRNSSDIVAALHKVDVAVWIFFSFLNACSSALLALLIIAALIWIDPLVATATLTVFAVVYGVTSALSRKRLAVNSRIISTTYNARVRATMEGLGAIRDVILDRAQSVFANRFNEIDLSLRKAQASNSIIAPSPRFAVEGAGMVLIAIVAYHFATSTGSLATAIPVLGAVALGAQRLMPLMQMIYQGWVHVAGNREVLNDVVRLLEQPVREDAREHLEPLSFEREIRLEKVSMRYGEGLPYVLRDVDLVIESGARVGIVGATGSGKSTLLDLLMGLMQADTGRVTVDGVELVGSARVAWQRNIAHVPQAIFLADASFTENIAFACLPEHIDMDRVRYAAQQAQIADFIESGPQGYAAIVGERGVRLSGGQRQRVGIARALYKQARVLVFDEATSALDSDTEQAVMQAMDRLGRDLTLVLVAHRLTTLQGCDRIYQVDNGRIVLSGDYQEVRSRQNPVSESPGRNAG